MSVSSGGGSGSRLPASPASGNQESLSSGRPGGVARVGFLRRLREDIGAVRRADPAARGVVEIAVVYSGLHAVWGHRLAHGLWESSAPGARFAARVLAQGVRGLTGVEIHPGARIGRRLFIDHGMGVVIGESAVIGDDVVMYHGVTLGGKGIGRGPRHPTVGDRVMLGAGASVLGAILVGADSLVGANTVVTHDVPPCSVVTGQPGVARPR